MNNNFILIEFSAVLLSHVCYRFGGKRDVIDEFRIKYAFLE